MWISFLLLILKGCYFFLQINGLSVAIDFFIVLELQAHDFWSEYTHVLPCPESKQVMLAENMKSNCPKGVKEAGGSDCPQVIASPE